ncbi:DUF2182 domain-containing protein [Cupriavidus sp. WKF15]|uniref:copper chaperone n=1 Tax=Cupriavidus sp. WKF15 TaxID=3032282 RepID=UPI0023E16518|nr:DUF2182 domain-containing protein [Cupriavidus sp. WKF15]WER50523.1 DUF2182 domain-containing protein [Cupriavidus sp. WKF15]
MVAAMMGPLLAEPLKHIRARSFAKRRVRAMGLFLVGYAAAWTLAAPLPSILSQAAVLAFRSEAAGLIVAICIATFWQISPAKQWGLNRCHRRPALAAFGLAADRDAWRYGLSYGMSCVAACWALMMLPLVPSQVHLPLMVAVSVFVLAERLEEPAPLCWKLRGLGTALRMVRVWARRRVVWTER